MRTGKCHANRCQIPNAYLICIRALTIDTALRLVGMNGSIELMNDGRAPATNVLLTNLVRFWFLPIPT